ncbi:polysaccharide pyruvyl transferase family protein [bacterium]|nr:polysaccharide pyruvyl transferase family protein [bacterium]
MKIGVLTFHGAKNYGAMLQAYALSTYISNNINSDTLVIDFRTKKGEKAYKIFRKPKGLKGFLKEINKFKFYFNLKERQNRFDDFLKNNFILTDRYLTYSELESDHSEFDVIISGSDQVFNPHGTQYETYLLKFCKDVVRKVAYAPSFGVKQIPRTKNEIMKSLLNKFTYLSARERKGCEIIYDLTSRKVPQVLDPVFLLSVDEYKKIEEPVKLKWSKYILCYSLVGIEKQLDIAIEVKKRLNIPIILLKDSIKMRFKRVDKIVRNAGPSEFLNLFRNADFVVTDSFHGTAFSINFKKNFYSTIIIEEKSDRIIDLLNKIGLSKQVINSSQNVSDETIEVDYTEADKKLDQWRVESISYLKQALK